MTQKVCITLKLLIYYLERPHIPLAVCVMQFENHRCREKSEIISNSFKAGVAIWLGPETNYPNYKGLFTGQGVHCTPIVMILPKVIPTMFKFVQAKATST